MGLNVSSFLGEMVKYPNLKWFSSSYAPFYGRDNEVLESEKCDDTLVLAKSLFDSDRNFVASQGAERTNISTLMIYNAYESDNRDIMKTVQKEVKSREFMNDIVSTVIKSNLGKDSVNKSVTMIENSSLFTGVLDRLSSIFIKMYWKRKAFVHWYKEEGMDHADFENADHCIRDLRAEYYEVINQKDEE